MERTVNNTSGFDSDVPNGTIVKVVVNDGDMLYVKLPNSRHRWMYAVDFQKI